MLLIELEEGHAIESDRQEFELCLFPLPSFSLFHHYMEREHLFHGSVMIITWYLAHSK